MRYSRENGILRPNSGPTIGCQDVPWRPGPSHAHIGVVSLSSKLGMLRDASGRGEIRLTGL